MLKQRKPMSRGTGFKSKAPPRPVKTYEVHTPRVKLMAVPAAPAANAAVFRPQPKDNPIVHHGYRALVRQLDCARCGWFRKGFMEFCHADAVAGPGGKGIGLKSDDRRGYSGCGPHDGLPGCHYLIGTARVLPKDERHEFEALAGQRTRTTIFERGLWPARLPMWKESP